MATLTDKERKDIQVQAKKILDNFASALSNVKVSSIKKQSGKISGFRQEGNGKKVDSGFRDIMFSNAHSKSGDNIVAETKEW